MTIRTLKGCAVVPVPTAGKAIAADVIGKLSRVSASDTLRVLAAIQLIAEHTGVSADELVKLENVPLEQPTPARVAQTNAAFAQIAIAHGESELGEFLRLAQRLKSS